MGGEFSSTLYRREPGKRTEVAYALLGNRRTGITLKEGRRDEHGMEEIDGMFSSPEKSPVRVNGFGHGDESVMGSDGMSMDEGTSESCSCSRGNLSSIF